MIFTALIALAMTIGLPSSNAAVSGTAATVTTDYPDYLPGDIVHIDGSGFAPRETVTLIVRHVNTAAETDPISYLLNHEAWSVVADDSGRIVAAWLVTADCLGATLELTATGATSGLIAKTTFTDGDLKVSATPSGNPKYTFNVKVTPCDAAGNSTGATTNFLIDNTGNGKITIASNTGYTLIEADAASSTGLSFVSWSADASLGMTDISPANPRIKVIQNSTIGSNANLTANYSPAQVATTTTVSASGITYGANGGVTVTVTAATGTVSPTGNVQLSVDGGASSLATLSSSGTGTSTATFTPTMPNAGNRALVATYVPQNGSAFTGSNGSGTLVVAKANQTITWANPMNITYGTPLGATQLNATVAGVSGGSAAGALTYTPAAGTVLNANADPLVPQTLSVTAAATSNYNEATKTVSINVLKAVATISVSGYTGIFDGGAHGASGTATGVGGASLTGLNLGDSFTNVPGGTANWTFSNPNYESQSGSVAITINKATANVSVSGYTGVYDAAAHGATGSVTGVGGVALSGLSLGNSFTNVPGGTANWTFSNSNYEDQSGSVAITINKLGITGSFTVSDKFYDGTTAATINTGSLSLTSVLGSEAVTLTAGTATFASKNVGTHAITGTGFGLGGTGAGNYSLISVSAANAKINKLGITGSFTVADKFYDGTAAATINAGSLSLSGVVGSEAVTLTAGTATFASKNVGTHVITGTGFSLGGADAGNYSLTSVSAPDATINKLGIIGSFTVADKFYDGTTAATINAGSLSLTGVLGSEAVTLTAGTATFASKNVGTYAITGTGFSVGGTDAGNYSLTSVSASDATINKLGIKGSFTVADKFYDGTTAATINTGSLSLTGVLGTEAVTLTAGTATFASKNVGTHVITGTGFSLGGADAANYSLTSVSALNASINKLGLSGSFTTGNKVYDGTANASVLSRLLSGVIGNEDVSLSGGVATFADKHVGSAKAVTLTGATLTGTDAGNYTLNSVATTTANITVRELVFTAVTNTKTYDGNASAAAIPLTSGLQTGDSVSGLGESYNSASAGTGKVLSVNPGYTINDGNGGKNYSVSTVINNTGVINKASAVISVTPYSVTYDAAAHTATGSVTGVLGEALAGLSLGGTTHTNAETYYDSWTFTDVTGNYCNASGQVTDVIAKADPTISVSGYNITYDGLSHTATGTAKGVLGETLAGLDLTGTSHIDAGPYSDTWTFTDVTGNYNNKTGSVSSAIAKAAATIEFSKLVQAATGEQLTPVVTLKRTSAPFPVPSNPQTKVTFTFAPAPLGSDIAPRTLGVYSVTATVSDPNYIADPATALFVIYDPTGGFVTGGGWIVSPSNAITEQGAQILGLAPNAQPTGKANFGFNAKYQKGANVPTGNTEFQFQAGNLNFKSVSYEWLVVQGASKAQFKGTGTINGGGSYSFMLTAFDGDGTSKPDAFRIKIWTGTTTIYDNQINLPDTSDTATVLGGGSIVIHDPGKK